MILGIDGSLSSTGWCVRDDDKIINGGKITTKKNPKINEFEDEDNRIVFICVNILEICKKYNIDNVCMEGQFISAIQSKKTAMQLSRLRGGITTLLKVNGKNIKYRQPSEVKKLITGRGNATKEEVAEAIIRIYENSPFVQNLGPFNDRQCKDKNSDIYDSIAIATCY